jgi:hypothetical protein
VQKLKARSGNYNPYAVCQASTGLSYRTGKPIKGGKLGRKAKRGSKR